MDGTKNFILIYDIGDYDSYIMVQRFETIEDMDAFINGETVVEDHKYSFDNKIIFSGEIMNEITYEPEEVVTKLKSVIKR